MPVAIITKYHGPTDTRGSRISARTTSDRPKVFVPYQYEYSHERAHLPAVLAYCKKMDWHGTLACGGVDDGYVWVFTESKSSIDGKPYKSTEYYEV
jgi:hypothetical protein